MGKKRKVEQAARGDDDTAPAPLLKRTRGATAKQAQPTAVVTRSKRTSKTDDSSPPTKLPRKGKPRSRKTADDDAEDVGTPKAAESSGARTSKLSEAPNPSPSRRNSTISVEIPRRVKKKTSAKAADDEEPQEEVESDEMSYWLMKAEPESRIEKGKDVKFSIDDLEACQEPEGWDGVRNMAARNNMRSMRKGDLAFFYHSNCKVPGIARIMEIVQEHSVDKSAVDPEHPYFDPKSDPENPKWSLVHVEFRQKFPALIKLKELQKFAKPGGVLENMQTLKQTRLSVSKLSKKEWDFILCLVEPDEESEPAVTSEIADANKLDADETAHTNGNSKDQDDVVDAGAGAEARKVENGVTALTNGDSKEQDKVTDTADVGSEDTTIHSSDLSVPIQAPPQPEAAPTASD